MYTWLALRSSADLAQLDAYISTEYAPRVAATKLFDGISSAVKAGLRRVIYV